MTVSHWAKPTAPRFEHREAVAHVLGLGTADPRLSWIITDAAPAFQQTAYEVEVTRSEGREVFLVESKEQVLVPWPGDPLASRESFAVRVRVSDGESWGPWSPPATGEIGLLVPEDWAAVFVSPVEIARLDEAGSGPDWHPGNC